LFLFLAAGRLDKFKALSVALLFFMHTSSSYAAPESCFVVSKLGQLRLMTYIGDRKCLTFDPPRTISGIWINEFEASSFHENIKRLSDIRLDIESSDEKVWLTIDDKTLISPELKRRGFGRAYRIKFIGRNVSDMHRKPGDGYGHGSLYSGLMLVERVIDWEDIGPADPKRR
jgi:hypothetical protein